MRSRGRVGPRGGRGGALVLVATVECVVAVLVCVYWAVAVRVGRGRTRIRGGRWGILVGSIVGISVISIGR